MQNLRKQLFIEQLYVTAFAHGVSTGETLYWRNATIHAKLILTPKRCKWKCGSCLIFLDAGSTKILTKNHKTANKQKKLKWKSIKSNIKKTVLKISENFHETYTMSSPSLVKLQATTMQRY